jgi:N-acyl-L-homoserine lactone synthetase
MKVITGCARLLPATKPTMLVDVFPMLLPSQAFSS